MRKMLLLLTFQLCCLFPIVKLSSWLDFYPFGSKHGDTEIPSPHLESANERISVHPGISIRGRAYDRVRVSTKGYLKFRTIEGNDLKYWKLTVVQNGVSEFTEGAVYYRQTTNLDLLNSTAKEVIKYFPSQDSFNPTWAMVITWLKIRIYNQEDDDVITSQQLLRTDVNICEDSIPTTLEPTTVGTNATEGGLQSAEAACVNASDATYIQEAAVRGNRERSSLATFQAVLTTDGRYTYYLLNYDGMVTCRGTGYLASDTALSDFSVTRDLVLPGPTNIGEHGKWLYEMGRGCSNKYDLIFALDTSGSMGSEDLETTKDMVLYILRQLELEQERIRAGLISFDDEVFTDLQLTSSLQSLEAILSGIQVAGGTSDLQGVISSVRKMFKQQNGGRPEVTQVAVIITDGLSSSDPSLEASLARSENIALIIVGIGRGVDYDQLRSVVSEPVGNNLLTVFNHDMLPALQDMLIDRICQVMPNTDLKTKPSTNLPAEGVFNNPKGTLLGGQRLDVYGPCYTSNATVQAVFGSQAASCRAISSDVASCIVPLVYFTGTIHVSIEVNGESLYSRYTYENPLLSNPGVFRHDPLKWTENQQAVISYDPDAITGSYVDIELFGYKESLIDGSITMKNLYTIAQDERKSNQFSFSRPLLTGIEDFSVGLIKVSGSGDGTHLWSDVHPILWAMEVTSSDACHTWMTSERSRTKVHQEDMTQCPCTLQQALNELGRFRQEPGCASEASVYCMTGKADAACFQSIDTSPAGYHQRCCYDEDGSLIDARHMTGGGTSSRYSPYMTGTARTVITPRTVPVFSNLYWDFVPFYHCCMGSNVTSHCRDFFQLRPPSDCQNYGGYSPSHTGAIDSDPVVSTLDGSAYVFSAVGEFVVLETRSQNLRIQGRVSLSTVRPKETILRSLVIVNPISGPDVVQIGLEDHGDQVLAILRVNGRLDYAQQTGTIALKGVTVTRETDLKLTVHLSGRGIAVQISVVADRLDVVFFVPTTLLGQLTGLLGYYDHIASNDFTARDGSIVAPSSSTADIHNHFVMSWLLTESESLFTYPKGRTFYSQSINDYSFTPSYVSVNDPALQVVSTQVARLCGQSLDCRLLLQAKLDKGESLNDTTIGAVQRAREALAKVTVCPFLTPSVDLTLGVNVSGYFPGDLAAMLCPRGWVVVGYDRLLCQESGEWDGNATYCEGVLYTEPPAGSMLGGQQIAIRGPHLIFPPEIIPYIRIAGVTVRCVHGGRYVAYCRTPMVTSIGVTTVYANAMNGSSAGWVYRGQYVYQNMASYAPTIRREEPDRWTAKGQHVITWSPEDVDAAYVSIELYGYKEDLLTSAITWQKLVTLQQQHDASSGRYVIDSSSMSIRDDFPMGILKMIPTTELGSALWSDVHPLTWAITMDHRALCRQFTSHDRTLPPLAEVGLISCPCSVQRAKADDINFKVDVGCSLDSGTSVNCLYNKGAQICFRSIPMSGWEQRCCYDDRGVLLNARDFTGGASPGRYHHDGSSPYSSAGSVPHLSHFSGDVMPYLHCCVYSIEFCMDYFTQRRPSDCVLEFPPRPALVEGDPHFVTFDEVSYTFDGLGEFVIMQAMNGSLQVQGRTESLQGVRGTCFTSFALKHTDTSVVEIRRSGDRQQLDIMYDRRQLSFNLTVAREYAFTGITIEVESPTKLSVSFPHLSFVMDIEVADEMMNAMLSVPRNFTDNTEGLLGIYNSDPADDFTSRDGYVTRQGLTAQSVHNNFGLSWRVSKDESLFSYDLTADYQFYNNQPYSPEYKASSDIDSRMVSGFVKKMCGSSKDCMYDYINKGLINVATRPEDRRMRDKFWLRLQDLTTSQSCGFLNTIADGLSRDVSGYGIGDTIRLTCSPGYRLVGASLLLCTDQGWDQEEGRCEPVSASTKEPSYRLPNPSFAIQETDSTPSWAVGTVVGVVGGVAAVGSAMLVVRGILVAKEVARIQAYKLTDPQFGTSGSARPSFKPDLL